MRIIVKYVLIVFSTILLIQCKKDDTVNDTVYLTFNTKILVDHNSPELSLTDTLWITSNVSAYLVDSATQERVFFSDAVIAQNIVVRSWDSINQTNQRDNYSLLFETNCNQLVQTSKASMAQMIYNKKGNIYNLKLGLLFKKTGTYCVDVDRVSIKTSDPSHLYGGGIVYYYDMNDDYHEGYLSASIENSATNYELYGQLSADAKSAFQVINESNKQKYYFVKAIEAVN